LALVTNRAVVRREHRNDATTMPLPHLLIIDDDALIRRVFARLLVHHFAVECVVDAEEGLAIIDGGTVFDAILSDLNLPGMSGAALYDALLGRSNAVASRLVIITGSLPTAHDSFAAMLGDRYLVKPCTGDGLTAALRKVAFPRLSTSPRAPVAAA
jgi:CheY-like chemotaxis protein